MNEQYSLSKSAQKIQAALVERGLALKVLELPSSTRTAIDAATTLNCEVAQIVKSLLFRTHATHQPILILVSGSNRINEKMLADLVGEKIIKADADFARQITGFAIGGIPPIAHKQTIQRIFIDQDLLKFQTLWAAAGTPFAVFALESKILESLTGGTVVAIN